MKPTESPAEPKWLTQARLYLGEKEVAGPDFNPIILAFFTATRTKPSDGDETAWCAAFVNFVLKRSNEIGTGSAAARSFERWGTRFAEVPGAICVFSRGDNSAHGHVGLFIRADAKRVWVLGGNQSDSVSIASYPRERLVAVRWPA